MIRRSFLDFGTKTNILSQSPDGDFFDPENYSGFGHTNMGFCHSPLTGIFLIRSCRGLDASPTCCSSQSPDGDFFDPEVTAVVCRRLVVLSHSPLTGIFLIRRNPETNDWLTGIASQSPDGDFFDPEDGSATPV